MVPLIDHVVVDVQDRIEDAARRYRALGFHLTELGRHSLGSVNHLAVFETDYLELLGTGDGSANARLDLADFPIGLNGLVFKLSDAAARHDEMAAAGVPVQPVQSFSRPVELAEGRQDAHFNVVRLVPRTVFDGRVYFCEHLTPELVWRKEWQDHPNGALSIARIVVAVRDPAPVARWFERMFGAGAVAPDGRTIRTGKAVIELASDATVHHDRMTLLSIRVRSLVQAEAVLRGNGVADVQTKGKRLLVPPAAAMNAMLEFVE